MSRASSARWTAINSPSSCARRAAGSISFVAFSNNVRHGRSRSNCAARSPATGTRGITRPMDGWLFASATGRTSARPGAISSRGSEHTTTSWRDARNCTAWYYWTTEGKRLRLSRVGAPAGRHIHRHRLLPSPRGKDARHRQRQVQVGGVGRHGGALTPPAGLHPPRARETSKHHRALGHHCSPPRAGLILDSGAGFC